MDQSEITIKPGDVIRVLETPTRWHAAGGLNPKKALEFPCTIQVRDVIHTTDSVLPAVSAELEDSPFPEVRYGFSYRDLERQIRSGEAVILNNAPETPKGEPGIVSDVVPTTRQIRKELVKVIDFVDPTRGTMTKGVILGVFEGDLLKLSMASCAATDTFSKEAGVEVARKRMAIAPQLQLYYNKEFWKGELSKRRFFEWGANIAGLIFSERRAFLIPIPYFL